MHKPVLLAVGVVWLVLSGLIGLLYKQHLDDQACIRRLVSEPNGPLPLGLWMGSPRKVVLEAISKEPNDGFVESNGPFTRLPEVRGLRFANQPCRISFEFSREALNELSVNFNREGPETVGEVERALRMQFGEPRRSGEGRSLIWDVSSPIPFTLYAIVKEDVIQLHFVDAKKPSPFDIHL